MTLPNFLQRSVGTKELAFATRHLALMVKSGVPLARSLEILGNGASRSFKAVTLNLAERIRRGEPFSRALASHPVFPPLYISLVRSAEAAGNLDEVLYSLALTLERDTELRRRVKSAFMYPTIIIIAMVGIAILLMTMVVPKLAETFEELEVELPVMTRAIIGWSTLMRDRWYLIPAVLALAVAGLRYAMRTVRGRRALSYAAVNVPLVRTLVTHMQIARLTRTLSSLLDGGVPMLEALGICRSVLQNYYFRESLVTVSERVEKGQSFAGALAGFEHLYSTMVQQMLLVGEETGSLVEILRHVAGFYENEVAETTKALSTLIEPLLMVVVGVAVGFFAIAMIQPMYGLLNAI